MFFCSTAIIRKTNNNNNNNNSGGVRIFLVGRDEILKLNYEL